MRPARPADRERGALSLMIVVLFVALIALAGLVVDGGAKLAAYQNAEALAQEAARAGATTVDTSEAYRAGTFVVAPQQAQAAAISYLQTAPAKDISDYHVSVAGTQAITVSVTITEPTSFLSLVGISKISCTRSATASLVTGVTGGT
jgi:Flp pilus assembly protein TadG